MGGRGTNVVAALGVGFGQALGWETGIFMPPSEKRKRRPSNTLTSFISRELESSLFASSSRMRR